MRALLPEPVADPDVHAHYARDWLDSGGIRANFISSVDGAAAAGGLSAGLQTPGDNRIFAALRDLADVVLVGSGTAVAENYSRPRPSGDRLARRREFGLADSLPLAVLTRSGRGLMPQLRMFADAGSPRPLVLTTSAADTAGFADLAEIVRVGETDVDFEVVRRALGERGLTRVLCEGGPTVFARMAAAGEVDELCLSISPMLTGPGPQRIVSGAEWPDGPRPLRLHSLLEEDGALFLRLRAQQ